MESIKTYLITYDLSKEGQLYPELYGEIELLGEYCHCFESVWIVKTTLSVYEIGVKLNKFIDDNDKLLVTRLTSQYHPIGLDMADENWLERNMPNQE